MSGDQYFSVVSLPVNAADFIASPEALMELYQNAHSGKKAHMRPYVNKYLHGVRDWTLYYAPLINSKLDLSNLIISSLSFTCCLFVYVLMQT